VHLFVICALVFAAAYVYGIKMESTVRTEKVLRLRAEWSKLESPLRLQGLADRHLELKPVESSQYDSLKNLPERPPSFARPGAPDPIGAMLDTFDPNSITGSVSVKPQESAQ